MPKKKTRLEMVELGMKGGKKTAKIPGQMRAIALISAEARRRRITKPDTLELPGLMNE